MPEQNAPKSSKRSEIKLLQSWRLISLAALIGTLIHRSKPTIWPFELLTHFPAYYCAGVCYLLLTGTILFFRTDLMKRLSTSNLAKLDLILATLICLCIGYFGGMTFFPRTFEYAQSASSFTSESSLPIKHVKIMSYNINSSNLNVDSILSVIEEEDPDILTLIELDPPLRDRIEKPLKAKYPFSFYQFHEANFSLGVYSRVLLENLKIRRFTSYGIPAIAGTISDLDSKPVFLAIHAPPPMKPSWTRMRDEILTQVGQDSRVKILLGDLNITPYSRAYQKHLVSNGFQRPHDSGWIHGTWPAILPMALGIPIDHILLRGNLKATPIKVLGHGGSDHRAISTIVFDSR